VDNVITLFEGMMEKTGETIFMCQTAMSYTAFV
jgi:hypothetical protein